MIAVVVVLVCTYVTSGITIASVYETEGSRFESWYPRSGAPRGVQSRIQVGLMTRNALRGAPKCLIVRADVRAETGRPLVGSGL